MRRPWPWDELLHGRPPSARDRQRFPFQTLVRPQATVPFQPLARPPDPPFLNPNGSPPPPRPPPPVCGGGGASPKPGATLHPTRVKFEGLGKGERRGPTAWPRRTCPPWLRERLSTRMDGMGTEMDAWEKARVQDMDGERWRR